VAKSHQVQLIVSYDSFNPKKDAAIIKAAKMGVDATGYFLPTKTRDVVFLCNSMKHAQVVGRRVIKQCKDVTTTFRRCVDL
jgi:hypothetical protein